MLKVRKINVADDFLVAGRSITWPLLFATMGATVIGGGYSIGAVGKSFEWGLLMVLISMGGYVHFIFSGLVVAPRFREARLYTVAGYFGHRFSEGPRIVAMILSLLFSVFIVAAQMAAIGSVLSTLMPDTADVAKTIRLGILIGGVLVVLYSTAGGLLAVIYTDVYQFVVLLLGFLITLAFIMPDMIATWPTVTDTLPDRFFEITGDKGWAFLITTFLAFLVGETFAPGYATRYCIGKDVRHTKLGIAGVGAFLTLVFPIIVFFIALYARMKFPEIEPQQALPAVIRFLHNPWISGIIIAALLSAVMSSADSALNSSTAIFVKDLFEETFHWTGRDQVRMLKIARICTAVLGVLAMSIAVLWSDIIELLLFTYQVWAPAIILPVVVGATTRFKSKAQNTAILMTMILSTAITFGYRYTAWAASIDPAVFGVFLSVGVFFVIRGVQRVAFRVR